MMTFPSATPAKGAAHNAASTYLLVGQEPEKLTKAVNLLIYKLAYCFYGDVVLADAGTASGYDGIDIFPLQEAF